MSIVAQAGPSSSSRMLPGTGRPLCVICGIKPHFQDARRSFPTCGLTCARKLQVFADIPGPSSPPTSPDDTRPKCVICKIRPQFNNGRRAFPTCGNTCAKILRDMANPPATAIAHRRPDGPLAMCYVCNLRPRCERGGKTYPTCGLTCAARLHAQDRQLFSPRVAREPSSEVPVAPLGSKGKAKEDHNSFLYSENSTEPNIFPVTREKWETFKCVICLEILQVDHIAQFSCPHTFCRPCLKEHITSELKEHHYPIPCPSCKVDDKADDPSTVDNTMIAMLGLGGNEIALFYELQLAAHSIVVHCQKCKETMFVDRREYEESKIIECPLPRCNYTWCKNCHQEVHPPPNGARHSCDGLEELEELMKEHGWRHCPGCQTPVMLADGCNHMTCLSPGCNTHFCYRCGKTIIVSLHQPSIRSATITHYAGCQLF